MDIGRTEGVQGPGNVQGPRRLTNLPPAAPKTDATDRVEISDAARLISELSSMPKVREDRIDNVRKLIESGKFETPERLEGALERFLDESGGDLSA
jgi:anti-sigma28 factor (negative regulator of flagellin synthesis)